MALGNVQGQALVSAGQFLCDPFKLEVPGCEGVEVFGWRLEADDDTITRMEALLSDDERTRRQRYRFAKDRRQFTIARAGMREFLARRLDVHPADLRFQYNAYGKPAIIAPMHFAHFNLSHAGGQAVLVIANRPVGIDIEAIRAFDEDVATGFFSHMENQSLKHAGTARERLALFYRIWTSREAVSKAEGAGFSHDQRAFEIRVGSDGTATFAAILPSRTAWQPWRLWNVPVGAGLIATIAAGPA